MNTGHPKTVPASKLEQVRTADAVVLRPVGTLGDALADDIRERALGAHAPVVIDLDACVRIEASAVERISSSWTLFRPEMCFAGGTAADRRMLESQQLAGSLAVFASVDQALEARAGTVGNWDLPQEPITSVA